MSIRETQGLLRAAADIACNFGAPAPRDYSKIDLRDSSDDESGSWVKKVPKAEPTEQEVFALLQSRLEGAEDRASRNSAPKYQPDERELKKYMKRSLREDMQISPQEADRKMKRDLKMDLQLCLENKIPHYHYRQHNPVPAPGPAPQAMLHDAESDDDVPLGKRLKGCRARVGKPGGSEPPDTERKEIKKQEKPKTPITYGPRRRAVTVMRDGEGTTFRRKEPREKRMK